MAESKKISTSEETEKPDSSYVHKGIKCDGCGKEPIVGFRFKCLKCQDFDLCKPCFAASNHRQDFPGHIFKALVKAPEPDPEPDQIQVKYQDISPHLGGSRKLPYTRSSTVIKGTTGDDARKSSGSAVSSADASPWWRTKLQDDIDNGDRVLAESRPAPRTRESGGGARMLHASSGRSGFDLLPIKKNFPINQQVLAHIEKVSSRLPKGHSLVIYDTTVITNLDKSLQEKKALVASPSMNVDNPTPRSPSPSPPPLLPPPFEMPSHEEMAKMLAYEQELRLSPETQKWFDDHLHENSDEFYKQLQMNVAKKFGRELEIEQQIVVYALRSVQTLYPKVVQEVKPFWIIYNRATDGNLKKGDLIPNDKINLVDLDLVKPVSLPNDDIPTVLIAGSSS